MSKQLKFTLDNSALQGNEIQLTFNTLQDDTVSGGRIIKYQYRYETTPLICPTTRNDSYHATYDEAKWTNSSKYDYYGYEGDTDATIAFVIPNTFQTDVVARLHIWAYDDNTSKYSIDMGTTEPFACFYNVGLRFNLLKAKVEEKAEANPQDIVLTIDLTEPGVIRPQNLQAVKGKTGLTNYINGFMQCFPSLQAPKIYWDSSATSNIGDFVDTSHSVNSSAASITNNWPHNWLAGTTEITIKDEARNEGANQYYRLSFRYDSTAANNYELAAPVEIFLKSNIVLLPAAVAPFQIKRRAVKAHLPENDSILGTLSTGAGMFNHNNLVGFDFDNKKYDVSQGHSIALYDTHIEEGMGVPTNEPSIGFMSHEHKLLGAIKLQKDENDEHYLTSTVPFKAEGFNESSSLPITFLNRNGETVATYTFFIKSTNES